MELKANPKISFDACCTNYCVKPFGAILGFLSNNTLSRAFLTSRHTELQNLHYGDILVKFKETIDADVDVVPFVQIEAIESVSSCSRLKEGDIVFADTAEDEAVGKCVEIVNLKRNDIVAGLHTMPCRPYEQFALGYLGFYLNSPAFHNQLLPLMQGTKVTSVSRNAIVNTLICFPNKKAQEQISLFFKHTNRLIIKTENEIKRLKDLKKAYRAMLFPQKGYYNPRVRFKGYSKDWKVMPLSDCLSVKLETCGTSFSKEDVLSVSGEFGVINQIAFQGRSFAGASISNYRVVKKGNVVYTKSPLKSNPYGIIKTAKNEEGIVSPLYAVYEPTSIADPNFIQVFFDEGVTLNNYLRPLINKGAKNTILISDETAISGQVVFPEIEEQREIAKFFMALDELISTNTRELESLKHIKAACLEKMFVNA